MSQNTGKINRIIKEKEKKRKRKSKRTLPKPL